MQKKLLDQLSDTLRTRHYSYRTEQAYIDWVRRYILFHQKRHPATLGEEEIRAFLTHLATDRKVAASTQNQALSAVLFLYREVLHKELDPILLSGAKRPERLPTVLTREEVGSILSQLMGTHKLMAQLLYGSGLRLMECVRLRVKDLDFDYKTITVRDGKGEKDRITPLPDALLTVLQRQGSAFASSTTKIWRPASDGSTSRTPSKRNIRMRQPSSAGNISFLLPNARWILVLRAPGVVIISKPRVCSAPSKKRRVKRRSISASPVTPSGIPLPPTSCKTVTTSAPFRNCSGTRTFAPP